MHSPHFGRGSSRTRRALFRVGAVLVGAALLLALAADHRTGVFGSSLALQVRLSALAPVAALSLMAVRRWRGDPRVVAAAGALAGAWSLGCDAWMRAVAQRPGSSAGHADAYTLFEIAALIVVLVLTVRYGAARPAAGAAVLLCLAVVLRPVAVRVTENGLILAMFCTVTVCAGLIGALAARLAALDRRRHAEQVRLEQRLTFARDLHDFVAHHVTGIVVQAQGAQVVAASRPELAVSALGQIERAGSEALRALRHMVSGLRTEDAFAPGPAPGDEAAADGVAGLRTLVAAFTLPGGGSARLAEEGPVDRLPTAAVAAVHRVTMEALTNVRKHAPEARQVTVTLRALAGTVDLDVVDDGSGPGRGVGPGADGGPGGSVGLGVGPGGESGAGAGPCGLPGGESGAGAGPYGLPGVEPGSRTDASATAGYGLIGLEERVTAEGGVFHAGPDSSGHWRVSARIPLESAWRDGP
ncbi:two-component sensor histidine kinase [Streptomyces sp. SID8356]|uniref:sensor histidine kinase n=1 Tax=unclassified Streptomyces TaxID=2593676 RepID=UPI00035DF455|nr:MULTISPECIES: histidine kinase [unclassified Streptomyces]MYT39194.1 two-component sensor histidine kinase [Streptomyces sp. SID8356]